MTAPPTHKGEKLPPEWVALRLASLASAERQAMVGQSRTARACHKAAAEAYETAAEIVREAVGPR